MRSESPTHRGGAPTVRLPGMFSAVLGPAQVQTGSPPLMRGRWPRLRERGLRRPRRIPRARLTRERLDVGDQLVPCHARGSYALLVQHLLGYDDMRLLRIVLVEWDGEQQLRAPCHAREGLCVVLPVGNAMSAPRAGRPVPSLPVAADRPPRLPLSADLRRCADLQVDELVDRDPALVE